MDGPAEKRLISLIDAIGTSGDGERFAGQITLGVDPDRFDTLCVSRWSDLDPRTAR